MKKSVIIALTASIALLIGGCSYSNQEKQSDASSDVQSESSVSQSSESKGFVSEYPQLNEQNVPFDSDASFMTDCKRYYVTVTEAEALGYTFSVCGEMINNNADYYAGYCSLYAFKDDNMFHAAALPQDGGQGGMKYVKTDIDSVLKAYVMTDGDKEYPFAVVTLQSVYDGQPALSRFYTVTNDEVRFFSTGERIIIPCQVESLSDDYTVEGNTLTDTKSNIKYTFDFEKLTVVAEQ